MTELRMRPEEIQAGATGFAGHADTLNTHAGTLTDLAAELPAAFAGFDGLAAPILAALGGIVEGIGQVTEQLGGLGAVSGTSAGQSAALDQQHGNDLIGGANS